MVAWARENAQLSGLTDKPVRWIVDDCEKFVRREIKRGRKYDGIVMDPPSYGRGSGGEIWKLEDSIYDLVELCSQVLSDKPLFFLINSYTTGLSPAVMAYILDSILVNGGECSNSGLGGLALSGSSGLVGVVGTAGYHGQNHSQSQQHSQKLLHFFSSFKVYLLTKTDICRIPE
jgi:hypothetical protein